MVEGSEPAALILEDDVLLAPDTAFLVQDSSWLMEEDCIVRLETYGMRVVLGHRLGNVQSRGLYPSRSGQHGAAAYIVTRAHANVLLRAYAEFIDTADRLMFGNPLGSRVYQFSPAPCIQRDIYEYGRIHGERSHLQSERNTMNRQSWLEPLALSRRLTWKLGSVARIGLDVAGGYSFQVVPFG